jgi:hypothetical protein
MTTNRIATYYRHLWQPQAQPPMVRFIVLGKGKLTHTRERYIFIWDDDDDEQRCQVLRTAGRWASDAGLSFTWGDAAKLSRIVRSKS